MGFSGYKQKEKGMDDLIMRLLVRAGPARLIAALSVLSGQDVVDDILIESFGWDDDLRDEAHYLYMKHSSSVFHLLRQI